MEILDQRLAKKKGLVKLEKLSKNQKEDVSFEKPYTKDFLHDLHNLTHYIPHLREDKTVKTIPFKTAKYTRSSSRKASKNSAKRSLKQVSSFLGKIQGSPTKSKQFSCYKNDKSSILKN